MSDESLNEQSYQNDAVTSEDSSAPAPEKMVTESEMKNQIRHAIARNKEKWQREGSNTQGQPQQNSSPSYQAPVNTVTAEDVKKIAAEAYQEVLTKQREELGMQDAMRVAQDFMGKLNEGKQHFEDFDEKMADLMPALQNMPHIVQLANNSENTAAIMYELANHPEKIADITYMYSLNPKLAERKIKSLADSIQINEKAKQVKMPNEPLKQIKPSPAGVDNGEARTVADFRSYFKNRGRTKR